MLDPSTFAPEQPINLDVQGGSNRFELKIKNPAKVVFDLCDGRSVHLDANQREPRGEVFLGKRRGRQATRFSYALA
jgi:hypothetical protein